MSSTFFFFQFWSLTIYELEIQIQSNPPSPCPSMASLHFWCSWDKDQTRNLADKVLLGTPRLPTAALSPTPLPLQVLWASVTSVPISVSPPANSPPLPLHLPTAPLPHSLRLVNPYSPLRPLFKSLPHGAFPEPQSTVTEPVSSLQALTAVCHYTFIRVMV